jgi:hypothetical protein
MVILFGLITLREEGSVVIEWFPVSILNDCVCVHVCDFHLPDSKKRHLCGVITLKAERLDPLKCWEPMTQCFPEDMNLQHWYLSWHV